MIEKTLSTTSSFIDEYNRRQSIWIAYDMTQFRTALVHLRCKCIKAIDVLILCVYINNGCVFNLDLWSDYFSFRLYIYGMKNRFVMIIDKIDKIRFTLWCDLFISDVSLNLNLVLLHARFFFSITDRISMEL